MSGGFPRPAFHLPLLSVLAALALSGCGLFNAEQAPAPIREAEATAVEQEPAPPVVTEAPEEPETPGHPAPKKPKKPVVKPHKVEEPPPPAPPPPPPPPVPAPIITMRVIERSTAHGLLDSEVQRPDGKVVGRAVDMITDASGTPRAMVVNLQGFLGVGDRKANFPWTAFRFAPSVKGGPITLNVPPGQIPASARPKLAGPFAGTTPPPVAPGQLPLLDANVERSNGGKVGRIVDVLIDGSGQAQAVVLDVTGIINPDRRTIAANWSA
ncbi:MAG: PRC-barrel domain-containing protein, partial [Paraburkholderia sp.]|nr:PRC-barrel domain-containing protein [Paraburkholderia sp.]